MNINIQGKNIEVTQDLKDYATTKASKMTRYFGNIQSINITLGLERGRSTAEITLMASGKVIRSEEKGSDMYIAIDFAVEKLEKQIRRYKERLKSRSQPNDFIRTINDEVYTEEIKPRVVKTKTFYLKPMHEEEAIEEMELLGHDFFLFLHVPSGNVGLIYRRNEGDLGLILGEI